jgi:hypothetical protein
MGQFGWIKWKCNTILMFNLQARLCIVLLQYCTVRNIFSSETRNKLKMRGVSWCPGYGLNTSVMCMSFLLRFTDKVLGRTQIHKVWFKSQLQQIFFPFPKHSDWPWGPPNLLFNRYQGPFLQRSSS